MIQQDLPRRSFIESLIAVPIGLSAQTQQTRRVPHAFVYDAAGPGRLLVGFAPAVRIEQFFRDLAKRGEYFGNGTAAEKETARRLYGIVNVGPPLKL